MVAEKVVEPAQDWRRDARFMDRREEHWRPTLRATPRHAPPFEQTAAMAPVSFLFVRRSALPVALTRLPFLIVSP